MSIFRDGVRVGRLRRRQAERHDGELRPAGSTSQKSQRQPERVRDHAAQRGPGSLADPRDRTPGR